MVRRYPRPRNQYQKKPQLIFSEDCTSMTACEDHAKVSSLRRVRGNLLRLAQHLRGSAPVSQVHLRPKNPTKLVNHAAALPMRLAHGSVATSSAVVNAVLVFRSRAIAQLYWSTDVSDADDGMAYVSVHERLHYQRYLRHWKGSLLRRSPQLAQTASYQCWLDVALKKLGALLLFDRLPRYPVNEIQ